VSKTVDAILDVKGLCCPLPAVKTAIKLEGMSPGEILEVVTTDEISKTDLPKWCEETGNTCVSVSDAADGFHIVIRKEGVKS